MFKTLHFHSGKQRFDPWSGKFRMPQSKTTKHYNRKIKSYYLSQTIGWKTASQITLRNCSREAWFSAQFFVLLGQRTSNKSARHSFKIEKKPQQISRNTVTHGLVPGKGVLALKE